MPSRISRMLGAAACAVAWLSLVHCGTDPVSPDSGDASATPDASPDVTTPEGADAEADTGAPSTDAGADADAFAFPPCTLADYGEFSARRPDGGVVHDTWNIASSAFVPGDPWRISNALQGYGREYFVGDGPGSPPSFPDGGTYPFTIGFGVAPETSVVPGGVFCFGAGTATPVPPAVDFRSDIGRSLGACPGGATVGGTVTLCQPGSCATPVQGALAGVTLDLTDFRLSGDAAHPPKFGVNGRGDRLVVVAISDTIPAGGETKPIHGIFVTNPTAAAPAAIYCIGDGSEVHWATAAGTSVTLTNVTKLGECGAAAPGDEAFRLCR